MYYTALLTKFTFSPLALLRFRRFVTPVSSVACANVLAVSTISTLRHANVRFTLVWTPVDQDSWKGRWWHSTWRPRRASATPLRG
ncbi:hypothetical protein EDB85DRAFT_1962998 [Lactarius pseudohatsudake]|nr:hypothetical protein EDB85DRAFT_1962998 [Lactarius pseudohatsudake]